MRRKAGRVLILLNLALMVFSAPRNLTKAEKLAYKIKPAVVLIQNTIKVKIKHFVRRTPVIEDVVLGSSGSGFIVHPEGYILTNGHVVKDFELYTNDKEGFRARIIGLFVLKKLREEGKEATVRNVKRWKLLHRPQITELEFLPQVMISNGKWYRYEIKKYSPSIIENGKDVAVIKIDRNNCPVLMLGDSSKVVLNQDIFAVGYPNSVDPVTHNFLPVKARVQPTITKGIISSVKADYMGIPVILTDANLKEGNSGGPVVDEEGKVIGVISYLSFIVTQDGVLREIRDYKFVIPINTAKEFLRDAGVETNIVSEFTKTYNQLLDEYWAGNLFKAKELVDVALSSMENQPDLLKLKEKILKDIQNLSPLKKLWLQSKLLVIAGIVVIVLIVIILYIALKPSPGGQFRPIKDRKKIPEREFFEEEKARKGEEKETVLEEKAQPRVTIFIRGNQMGEEVLPEEGAIVGRDPSRAKIVIAEPIVSKVHCKIIPKEGDEFLVVDLNSTNGTYVAGKKISQEEVKSGDSIQLGRKGEIILIVKK